MSIANYFVITPLYLMFLGLNATQMLGHVFSKLCTDWDRSFQLDQRIHRERCLFSAACATSSMVKSKTTSVRTTSYSSQINIKKDQEISWSFLEKYKTCNNVNVLFVCFEVFF